MCFLAPQSAIRLIVVIFMEKVTFLVRQATLDDLITVSDILTEVAVWLEQKNMGLWKEEHISFSAIRQDIELGLFYIAFYEGIAAGVVIFQTEDLVFWSDISQSDSAFLHRLAVKRKFAGGLVSKMLLQWTVVGKASPIGESESKAWKTLFETRLCRRSSAFTIDL